EDVRLYVEKSFGPEIQAVELGDAASMFLIAERNGEAAGYARLREGLPPTDLAASRPVEIGRLYARTRSIGRGVGAALMRASLHEADSRGCDAVWLGVWERNTRAIDFYRRWGFVECGSQAFLLGNDLQRDLIMARPVTLDESS